MTSALLGMSARGLDPDIDTVRQTLDPPRDDGPAEEQTQPEWNDVPTDTSGQLSGLAPRQLAGDLHESEQYAPSMEIALEGQQFGHIIDNQISSSGTAAAREAAGIYGHGTEQYAVSLEPVIRPGARFSSDYFVSNPLNVQEGSGDYMGSPIVDPNWEGVAAERYNRNSRAAYADLYSNLFAGPL